MILKEKEITIQIILETLDIILKMKKEKKIL